MRTIAEVNKNGSVTVNIMCQGAVKCDFRRYISIKNFNIYSEKQLKDIKILLTI